MSDTLALISQARQALATAQTLPDIRRVMEAAAVASDAGRRAAKLAEAHGLAAEAVREAEGAANDAAAVRIEAQAKAGELLRQMAARGVRATTGDRQPGRESQAATLGELGVTKSESSRWQRVASVPEPVRQEYVARATAERDEVSTAGLLSYAAATAALDEIDPGGAERQRQADLIAAWSQAHAALAKRVGDLSSFDIEEVAGMLDEVGRLNAKNGVRLLADYCARMERALAVNALHVLPGGGS